MSSSVEDEIPPRTVDVRVSPASAEERGVLDALMQLYVYDFSAMLALDVGDDGRYKGPPIEGRDAFLVRVDGKLAGFALIVGKSRLTGEEGVHDVAEFFVLERYRRAGVGETAARWLFDRYPGRWEVRQKEENARAIAFWRRVVDRYTSGRFDEEALDDERWRGRVQRFDTRR